MKPHRLLIVLSILAIALPQGAWAAQPEEKEPQPQTPNRSGERRRPNRRPSLRDPSVQLARMQEELKLDESQKTEIEKLLVDHDAKIRELRGQYRPTPEENEEMQAIRDEMRQAREAGDAEKMTELRERIRAFRDQRQARMQPVREALNSAEKKLHDDILARLNDDQKSAFEDVWTEVMRPRDARRGSKYDPRLLHNVVMRLKDLTVKQETDIENTFKAFREQQRAKPKTDAREGEDAERKPDGDKEAKRPRRDRKRNRFDEEAAKKLHADVMAILTEAQRQEVEKQLERVGEHGRRGERGPRDGRGDRGRFREPGKKPPPDKDDSEGA